MSTLKEIAKECGVATSTVSRAFDENSRISKQVRQRILNYASEVEYTPNLIARSLKKSETKTVAMIIPAIENMFYIDVLQHIEASLKHYGYRLLVSFVQTGITTERECLELMTASQVDAMIILPQSHDNELYITSLLNKMKFIQLFNAPFQNIDSVVMDDYAGTVNGTDYLISKGHKRIIYLGDNERLKGFFAASDKAGIPRYDILALPYETTVEVLSDSINHFKPTAIFAVSWTSEIAWKAIKNSNLSIPNDISILVYDNTKWVSLMDITAVSHDLESIANSVVTRLVSQLMASQDQAVSHTVLKPYIIERNSIKNVNSQL